MFYSSLLFTELCQCAETGVFTVPVSGIYAFSFSAEADTIDPVTTIYVLKNDVEEFMIRRIGYIWTMSLVQNDRLQLKMVHNGLIVDTYVFVWWNGHLLMQQ